MTLERLVQIEGPFATDAPQRLPHLLTTQFGVPEFAWLYRGWEDFMWRNRSRMAMLYPWQRHWRRTHQLQEARLGGHILLSRREVEQRLHREKQTLKRLLELEHLYGPAIPAADPAIPQRHWRLIEAESVEQVQQSLAAELTLHQTAVACGLSEGSVLQLVKEGLLPALRGPTQDEADRAAVWTFHAPSIRDALVHLVGHVLIDQNRATPNNEALTLSQALRMVSATALSIVDIIHAVQAGQLPCTRASDTLELTTLRFERIHLETFVAQRRTPERDFLRSLEDA